MLLVIFGALELLGRPRLLDFARRLVDRDAELLADAGNTRVLVVPGVLACEDVLFLAGGALLVSTKEARMRRQWACALH